MVALLTSVRNSPCFGGLRRTKTCHWQLFARPSTCFLVTFCTTQKVTSRSPSQEASRFSKPRFSSPKQRFRTNKIKTFHQGSFEVFQTSNQRTKNTLLRQPIKSFAAPRAFAPPRLPPHGRLAHVRSQFSLFRRSPTHKNLPPATFCTSEQHFQQIFALRAIIGGHAAFWCCLRQLAAALGGFLGGKAAGGNFPLTRKVSSMRQNDLPDVFVRIQYALRFLRLFKRKRRIDFRLDRSAFKIRIQLFAHLGKDLRLEFRRAAA